VTAPAIRIGQGWDVHRLAAGRPLRLGGVAIPSDRGLLGHSDGDVVLHALGDALLGAAGAGDLGTHFPDTDPRWAGADSARLLGEVVALIGTRGFRVGNVDVTIIAERPALAPHRAAMQARIAALLGVAAAQVSLKAKTAEQLGAIGRGEAIAALAVATLTRTRGRAGRRRPARRTRG
jgi:2-C-methyl-D-erythritol 2,4-cyclodiphosphate synthase